jgi:hypothetical protein
MTEEQIEDGDIVAGGIPLTLHLINGNEGRYAFAQWKKVGMSLEKHNRLMKEALSKYECKECGQRMPCPHHTIIRSPTPSKEKDIKGLDDYTIRYKIIPEDQDD